MFLISYIFNELLARVQAQGKNSGAASKTRYFVKRPFS
jgi:hypothetical protein